MSRLPDGYHSLWQVLMSPVMREMVEAGWDIPSAIQTIDRSAIKFVKGLSFRVLAFDSTFTIGLWNTGAHGPLPDFAFRVSRAHKLFICERSKSGVEVCRLAPGDVLTLLYNGEKQKVEYARNAEVLYTSEWTPLLPFRLDTTPEAWPTECVCEMQYKLHEETDLRAPGTSPRLTHYMLLGAQGAKAARYERKAILYAKVLKILGVAGTCGGARFTLRPCHPPVPEQSAVAAVRAHPKVQRLLQEWWSAMPKDSFGRVSRAAYVLQQRALHELMFPDLGAGEARAAARMDWEDEIFAAPGAVAEGGSARAQMDSLREDQLKEALLGWAEIWCESALWSEWLELLTQCRGPVLHALAHLGEKPNPIYSRTPRPPSAVLPPAAVSQPDLQPPGPDLHVQGLQLTDPFDLFAGPDPPTPPVPAPRPLPTQPTPPGAAVGTALERPLSGGQLRALGASLSSWLGAASPPPAGPAEPHENAAVSTPSSSSEGDAAAFMDPPPTPSTAQRAGAAPKAPEMTAFFVDASREIMQLAEGGGGPAGPASLPPRTSPTPPEDPPSRPPGSNAAATLSPTATATGAAPAPDAGAAGTPVRDAGSAAAATFAPVAPPEVQPATRCTTASPQPSLSRSTGRFDALTHIEPWGADTDAVPPSIPPPPRPKSTPRPPASQPRPRTAPHRPGTARSLPASAQGRPTRAGLRPFQRPSSGPAPGRHPGSARAAAVKVSAGDPDVPPVSLATVQRALRSPRADRGRSTPRSGKTSQLLVQPGAVNARMRELQQGMAASQRIITKARMASTLEPVQLVQHILEQKKFRLQQEQLALSHQLSVAASRTSPRQARSPTPEAAPSPTSSRDEQSPVTPAPAVTAAAASSAAPAPAGPSAGTPPQLATSPVPAVGPVATHDAALERPHMETGNAADPGVNHRRAAATDLQRRLLAQLQVDLDNCFAGSARTAPDLRVLVPDCVPPDRAFPRIASPKFSVKPSAYPTNYSIDAAGKLHSPSSPARAAHRESRSPRRPVLNKWKLAQALKAES